MRVQELRDIDLDTRKAAAAAAGVLSAISDTKSANEEPKDEKRKFARIGFVQPVIVKIGGSRVDAMAYNVSRGGMCFISSTKLTKGKACIVRNDLFAIFKDAFIVSVGAPDLKGMIRYGVQFTSEYSILEFSELLTKISNDS